MAIRNQIQLRRGTYSEWDSVFATGVLASGEPGFVTDFDKLKIGDGVTEWSDLTSINDAQTTIVHNATGSSISALSVVYINGGQGDKPTITKSIASTEAGSAKTYGIVVRDIPINGDGLVVTKGLLKKVDTLTPFDGITEGTTLYLSPTVAGGITTTKPSAPNHMVGVGKLIRVHQTQGVISVDIQNGFELDELHDVAVIGVTNNQYIKYNSATSLWEPTSSGIFNALSVSNDDGSSISLIDPDIDIYANEVLKLDGETSILLNSTATSSQVGIATAFPDATLDVAGDIKAEQIDIVSSVSGATLLNIEGTNGNLFSVVDNMSGSLMSVNDITGLPAFEVFSDHSIVAGRFNTNDFVISSGGNVLVGTSSGNYKFQVYGSGNDVLFGYADTGTAGGKVRLYVGDNDSNSQGLKVYVDKTSGSNFGINGTANGSGAIANYGVYGYAAQATTNFALYGYAAGGTVNRGLWVDAGYGIFDDRVGIGTTTPSGMLHIYGDTYAQGSIYVSNTSPLGALTYNRIYSGTSDNFIIQGGANTLTLSGQGGNIDMRAYSTSVTIGNSYNAGTTNQFIRFMPANSEAMRITNIGRVGIGTTSPAGNLSVVGADNGQVGIHVHNTTTTGYSAIRLGIDSAAGSQINIHAFNSSWGGTGAFAPNAGNLSNTTGALTLSATNAAGTIQFYTAGTGSANERVRITNTGSVGISRPSPSTTLDVGGVTTVGYQPDNDICFSVVNDGTVSNFNIRGGGDIYTAGDLDVRGSAVFNEAGANVDFRVEGDTDQNLLFVDASSDRVGIGTSSPAVKCHIEQNTTTYAELRVANSSTSARLNLGCGGSAATADVTNTAYLTCTTSDRFLIRNDNTNGYIDFATGGISSSNIRMRLDNTGNVGIGTTTPSTKLDVNGSALIGKTFFSDTVYSFGNGILVATDIATTDNFMCNLTIEGNSYDTNKGPVFSRVQFYNYVTTGTIISTSAISTDKDFSIDVFHYNGYVYLWFAQTGQYQTYTFKINTMNSGKTITAITNAIKPTSGVTNSVTITPYKIWNAANDGASSGLDADLLDGQHGSYYQPLLTNPVTGTGTSGYISKWNGTTTQGNSLIYDNGTNVAVGGITNPGTNLHVYGGSSTQTPTNIQGLFVENNGTSNSYYVFQTATGSGKTFSITNAGNVGIGTTTPSQIFQVGPTTPTGATPYALLNGLRISGGDTSNTIWNAGRDIAISRDSGGLISLSQTSVRTIGLTVNTTNGNVGLGTTSAGTILSLQRSDATSYTGTHNSISNNGIDIYNNQSSVTDAFAGISFRVAGSGYTNVGTGSINLVNTGDGDGDLTFVTRNNGTSSEKLRITYDGKVGIGTSSPGHKLTVDGVSTTAISIKTPWAANAYGQLRFDTGTGSASIRSNVPGNSTLGLEFYTYSGGAESVKMSILGDGKVGIGLTDPDEKLEVNGNIHLAANGILYFGVAGTNTKIIDDNGSNRTVLMARGDTFDIINAAGNGFSATLRTGIIAGGSTATNNLVLKSTTGVGTTDYISLAVGNNGGTEGIRIINNGNVGIGTTTPSEKLEINGNLSFSTINSKIYLRNDSARIVGIENEQSSPNSDLNLFARGISSGWHGNIKFYTSYNTNVLTERVRITSDGNVGIGTSSPSQKLDVVGIGKFGEAADVVYVGNDYIGGEIGISTASEYIAVHTLVDNKFRYGGDGGSNIGIVIDSSYNVGVGTESPTYKLQVNGSFGATTKSFRIDHPSRPNYTLEYGSLESPYHGVRLTGRGKVVKGSGTVLLPSYLKDLIHDDETINIQITNIKHGKTIYVDEIDLNNDQFTVRVDRAKTLGELEFFWTFTGTRKDVDKLVVEAEK